MKVKCVKILNTQGKETNSSPWLTINNVYVVLEIITSASKGMMYRLVGDNADKSPAIYAASQFEMVTSLIPSNWVINIANNGLIVLGPKEWRAIDFWDSCYDGDLEKLEIYKREAKTIMEDEKKL